MILIDNIAILRKQFAPLWNFLRENEQKLETAAESIQVVSAKNGADTMFYMSDDKQLYIHSQYNPVNEAEKFVDTLVNVEQYKHILFFGVGLGYHLEAFFNKYGSMPFTIFEPEAGIFYRYMETRLIKSLPLEHIKNIYLGFDNIDSQLNHFLNVTKDSVLIVVPPSYERVFSEKTKEFYSKFHAKIDGSRQSMHVNLGYEIRWIVNSIKNFPKVLKTANVFRSKAEVFRSKPVILAAAGPSLQEEYENLRYIKEKGLAYIIAVGSANKALLNNGIKPDAVTSYDPNPWNYKVYEEVIEQKIDDIPLIFGSSVGFETLDLYPGSKLHMITSQDTVSMYFLNKQELDNNGEIVSDAPSIAVITVEMLAKLGVNPIILAGQNFAIKQDQYYSDGIKYETRSTAVTEGEKASLVEVEGVDGEMVQTLSHHNSSRYNMELVITKFAQKCKIINTTKGGAKIHGTDYMTMDRVIEQYLQAPVVESGWWKEEDQSYNFDYIAAKLTKIKKERTLYNDSTEKLIKHLRRIDECLSASDPRTIDQILPKFDKDFKGFIKNEYVDIFIRPMLRVQFEIFMKSVPPIKAERDSLKKARMVLEYFGKLIYDFQNINQILEPMFFELITSIEGVEGKDHETRAIVAE